MKKLLIALALILSIGTVSAGTYSIVTANYPILVNGQKVAVQPYNLNGTTLLPIRQVSDALGVPINWNNSTRTVEINTVDVDRLKEACVMIFAENLTQGSQGSAVCWDYGEYLTAYHIVDNGQTNIRTSDNATLTVGETNDTMDIATLAAADNVTPVKIGDSDEVKVGDKVIVVSSPNGKSDTVTYATVQTPSENNIVIWADIAVGSSGGGVFNLNGELIGVVVSGSGFDKSFLVIPINDIRKSF